MRKLILIKVGFVSSLMVVALMPPPAFATGEASCQTNVGQRQAGEAALSGSYIVGGRASIEGQSLPLCTGAAYASGSFHWAAIENLKPAWNNGANIVQVGYGRCLNVNNGLGVGNVCDGNYYNYWAWGSYCGGVTDGTVPGHGPIPIRVGPPMANPPSTNDYYILRETLSGVVYYSAYVNGSPLVGSDATGFSVIARVPASSICWDSDQTDRRLAWFGETFNIGDSMGGWTGATQNNLDYNPLRYTVNSGWVAPSLAAGNPCNVNNLAPLYSCAISAADHIYINTTR